MLMKELIMTSSNNDRGHVLKEISNSLRLYRAFSLAMTSKICGIKIKPFMS